MVKQFQTYLLIFTLCGLMPLHASEAPRQFFDIDAMSLESALIEFSQVSGIQVMMNDALMLSDPSPRLQGFFSPQEVLEKLLLGTELVFQFSTPTTVVVFAVQGKRPDPRLPANALPEPVRIEEIIVTSQKREEALLRVPLAASVVSQQAFHDGIVSNIENLTYKVPTLNFRKGNNPRQSSLFLRGVGTISFSLANEASVSTVVDDVVLNQSGQAFSSLYDIERMEVLRGPQGTLFGKNASSGLVNIVTKGPTAHTEGYLETSYFQGSEYKVKSGLSGAISNDVNARLTAYYGQLDGLVDDHFKNQRVNGYEDWGARLQLETNAVENFSVKFSADYLSSESNCCAQVLGSIPDNPAAKFVLEDLYHVKLEGRRTRSIAQNFDAGQDQRNWGLSLLVDWDIADHTLTTISAYRRWEVDQLFDQDMLPTVDFVGLREMHNSAESKFEQWSHELRLASPLGKRFDYVIGGFLWKAENRRDFGRRSTACRASSLADVAPGVTPCGPTSIYVSGWANGIGVAQIDNASAFGQLRFSMSERSRLLVGARYSYDRVRFRFERIGVGTGAPGIPINTPYRDNSRLSHDDLSLRTALQLDLNQNVMAYLSYGQGYKGPGFNVSFGMNPGFEGPIAPETSDAYEVGIKGRLLDDRLAFGVAGFYAKYHDFQSNSFVIVGGEPTVALTNAGTVETQGFEVDFRWLPTEKLSLFGGMAYTEAIVGQFKINHITGFPSAPNGSSLPFAPDLKMVIGAEYRIVIDALPFDLLMNSEYTYSDEQFSALGENAPEKIPSYGLWNASIALLSKDHTYRLAFVANNLLDDQFVAFSSRALEGQLYNITRDADRYFGVTARVSF